MANSGYAGYGIGVTGASAGVASRGNSTQFNLTQNTSFDAANIVTGKITLDLVGTNKWAISAMLSDSANGFYVGVGSKTLSGVLDRVSLVTEAGTATLDGSGAFDLAAF